MEVIFDCDTDDPVCDHDKTGYLLDCGSTRSPQLQSHSGGYVFSLLILFAQFFVQSYMKRKGKKKKAKIMNCILYMIFHGEW